MQQIFLGTPPAFVLERLQLVKEWGAYSFKNQRWSDRVYLASIRSFGGGVFRGAAFRGPDVKFVLLKMCRGVHFGLLRVCGGATANHCAWFHCSILRWSRGTRLVSFDFAAVAESFSTSPQKMGRTLVFMAETGAFQFGFRVMESVSISNSFSVCLSPCLHWDHTHTQSASLRG